MARSKKSRPEPEPEDEFDAAEFAKVLGGQGIVIDTSALLTSIFTHAGGVDEIAKVISENMTSHIPAVKTRTVDVVCRLIQRVTETERERTRVDNMTDEELEAYLAQFMKSKKAKRLSHGKEEDPG